MLRVIRTAYLNAQTAFDYQQFAKTGQLDDLQIMIAHAEELLAICSPKSKNLGVNLHNLSTAYLTLFELTGGSADIDAAIEHGERAVAVTRIDSRARGAILSNLSSAYLRRFESGSAEADLTAAIDRGEQAVVAAGKIKLAWSAPRRHLAMSLSNLALTYFARFERYGAVADVRTSIKRAEQALAIHPAKNPIELGAILTNLCIAHLRLYMLYGTASDLQLAIEWGEQARWTTPPDHPELGDTLSNISLAYLRRYDRHGDAADLKKAIEDGERAANVLPAKMPTRGAALSNLGTAYLTQFKRTGNSSDLNASIAWGKQAVAATATDNRDLGTRLTNLAVACQQRFERDQTHADLRTAVESAEQAFASTPAEDPDNVRCLGILASTYLARVRAGLGPPDQSAVVRLIEQLTGSVGTPPMYRAYGAYSLGLLLGELGMQQAARRMLREAIQTLPSVAPRELTWGDQEYLLGRLAGLVAECVSAELDGGDVAGAVEHAELGRAVLLSAQLDTRADLTELDDASPSLGARFRELSDELNHPVLPARDDIASMAARRRALSADWDKLIRHIRQMDGFEHFLARPSLADLQRSANDGTVVLVNAGRSRGDAVLVRADNTESIRLGELRLSDVNSHAEALLMKATSPDSRNNGSARQRLLPELLEWLWTTVTEPVLDALGHVTAPAAGQCPPRVWWMPTGRLGLLPLHAAGLPGGPSVLDRVVSSYTPSLRALLHSQRQCPADARRQLTVALEHTPGQPDLPGALAEATRLSGSDFASPSLVDGMATTGAVLTALRSSTWAHFACHAVNNPVTPSNSGLLLHDGPLRVATIGGLRLTNAELAYLSACSTAQAGWDYADEAIHLASVFQLAGYRHVVGALWPLSDGVAQVAARLFYDQLLDTPRADQAPFALHQVCQTLRSASPDRPDLWAGLVHSGP